MIGAGSVAFGHLPLAAGRWQLADRLALYNVWRSGAWGPERSAYPVSTG